MNFVQLTVAAGLAVLLGAQAEAQDQSAGELTLYGHGHYSGPRMVLDGPARAMELPFTVKSVSVPEGTSWELCSGSTFTGCSRFSQSKPAMAMTVRSARPVGRAVAVPGGTINASGKFERAGPSPSLRGMRSEYFVAPDKHGNRIEVKPGTADEAARRATEFCRSIGWGASAHADQQVAGSSAYLVDVLCVRTGG